VPKQTRSKQAKLSSVLLINTESWLCEENALHMGSARTIAYPPGV